MCNFRVRFAGLRAEEPDSQVSSWYDGTSTDEVKNLLAKSKEDAAVIPTVHSHAVETVAEIKKFASQDSGSSANAHPPPAKVKLSG
jgi:hypothetical protein